MVGGKGNPNVRTDAPVATDPGVVVRVAGTVTTAGGGASTTVTQSSASASLSSVSLLAANTNRLRFSVYNDSATAKLYLRLDASAATTTNNVTILQPAGYFEPPVNYTGEVRGIWDIASGAARIGEYT